MVLSEDSKPSKMSGSASADSLLNSTQSKVEFKDPPPKYEASPDDDSGEHQPMMIFGNLDPASAPAQAQEGGANFIPSKYDMNLTNNKCVEKIDGQVQLDMSINTEDSQEDDPEDHWSLVDIKDTSIPWDDLTSFGKVKRVILWFLKPILVVFFLYSFICSLDLMSSAFRLLGGKTAGEALSQNELLSNPICGLMIGIMVTVLVQSSSTSTSIIVSMVAAELLQVQPAIFIIMGANIGTSVTNTIVSLAQSGDRNEFRRAFGGATVHDMFNWLAVIVLLPIEAVTGYLYRISSCIVGRFNIQSNEAANVELLKVLTKPFTKMIIQIDSKVLNKISTGELKAEDTNLLKKWCEKAMVPVNSTTAMNATEMNITVNNNETLYEEVGTESCHYLFADTNLSETAIGGILLFISLLLLCVCLICLVKVLNSLLRGHVARVIKKTLNANLPGKLSWLTGYIAILIGAVMTFIVQSSSVFTSAMTPLVGMGVIKLERMYPLTLGSNIGTTATGILAALASSSGKFESSLQIALCHLLFNISGILLWYPVPFMRKIPIKLAKGLGNTTADYRWFAIVYLVCMFFLLPGFVFALSMAGVVTFLIVGTVIISVLLVIVIINILQTKCCQFLPEFLRTWDFLPLWMHSLEPIDTLITKLMSICKIKCCSKSRPKYPNSESTSHLTKISISNSSESTSHLSKNSISNSIPVSMV